MQGNGKHGFVTGVELDFVSFAVSTPAIESVPETSWQFVTMVSVGKLRDGCSEGVLHDASSQLNTTNGMLTYWCVVWCVRSVKRRRVKLLIFGKTTSVGQLFQYHQRDGHCEQSQPVRSQVG
jgi:hypothetical protein